MNLRVLIPFTKGSAPRGLVGLRASGADGTTGPKVPLMDSLGEFPGALEHANWDAMGSLLDISMSQAEGA